MFYFIYHFNPIIPAKLELIAIDEPILVLIENGEHLFQPLLGHDVNVPLVVAEQRTTDESEFGERQEVIAERVEQSL